MGWDIEGGGYVGAGKSGSCRSGVGHPGLGRSCRGGVGLVGWDGPCRGGVGWVMEG